MLPARLVNRVVVKLGLEPYVLLLEAASRCFVLTRRPHGHFAFFRRWLLVRRLWLLLDPLSALSHFYFNSRTQITDCVGGLRVLPGCTLVEVVGEPGHMPPQLPLEPFNLGRTVAGHRSLLRLWQNALAAAATNMAVYAWWLTTNGVLRLVAVYELEQRWLIRKCM